MTPNNLTTFDATTLGELMLRLSVPVGERLATAARFDVHPGGAESNLAALLARLGRRCAWVGALPDNALGRLAAQQLAAAGVHLDGIHWCDHGRIGTYYVEFSGPPRPIQVIYDRADSCMAQLTPAQVNWPLLLDTRLLHLTGITPALSANCRQATAEALRRANAAGVAVSFDVNYRQKLWDEATASSVLAPMLRQVDLLFCGHGDAQRLFGAAGEPERALRQLAEMGSAQAVVMSVGDAGALAWQAGAMLQVPAVPAVLVDRLGAGDALAAGVIHGWLDGDLERGLRIGAILAALALSQHGDMVVTTPAEVETLLAMDGGAIVR